MIFWSNKSLICFTCVFVQQTQTFDLILHGLCNSIVYPLHGWTWVSISLFDYFYLSNVPTSVMNAMSIVCHSACLNYLPFHHIIRSMYNWGSCRLQIDISSLAIGAKLKKNRSDINPILKLRTNKLLFFHRGEGSRQAPLIIGSTSVAARDRSSGCARLSFSR